MATKGDNDTLCTLLITYTDFAEQKELTTAHTFSSTNPGHYPQRRRFVHSLHSLRHEGGTDARGGSLSDGEGHATTGRNSIGGDRQRRRISTSTYSSVGNLGSTLVESEISAPTPFQRPVTMKHQPSSSSAMSPPVVVVVSPQRSPYVNTSTSGSATDSRSNSRQLNIQEVTISYSRPGQDSRSMHLSPLTATSTTSTTTTFPTSGDLGLHYRQRGVPPPTGAKSASVLTTGIVDSHSRTTKFSVKGNAKSAGATEFSSAPKLATGANVIRLPTREPISPSAAKNGFKTLPSHGDRREQKRWQFVEELLRPVIKCCCFRSAPSSAKQQLPSPQKQHHVREETYESLEESITRRDASKSSKRVYQHCTSEVLTKRTLITSPTTTVKAANNIRATPSPTLINDRSTSRHYAELRDDGIRLHAKYDDDPGVGRRPTIITGQPQLLKPLPQPHLPAITTTFLSTEEVISVEERVSAPRRPDVDCHDAATSRLRSEKHAPATPAAPPPPLLIEAKDLKVVVMSDESGQALGDHQPLRFIDYNTYRSEVEQLQQKAVEQEHSPLRVELEEPVPLAPALVVISPTRRSPKSSRPSGPPPPRPNEPLLKYFSREDLEEREQQHHYHHVGGKTLQKEVENISYPRKEPAPLIVQAEMVETSEVEVTREYERVKEIPRDELARKLYQHLRPILDTKHRATQQGETPALMERGTEPRRVESTESGTQSDPAVHRAVEVVIQRDEMDESLVESHDEPTQPTNVPMSPRGDFATGAPRALEASRSVDLVDSGRRLLATLRRELLYDESVDLEIQRRRLLMARPTADIPEEDEEGEEEETSEGKGSSEEREQILQSLREEEELLRRKQAELDAQLQAQLQHEEQTRLRAMQREEEEARRRAIEMVSKAVKEREQEGGEEIRQSEIDPESRECLEYEARIVREGRRPVPQFTQQPTTPSIADRYQQHQSSRTFTSTAELKLLELPSSPQHHSRMEQASNDYRSTISSRHGYSRPHHTLSPTPTGHRVLKMVSETSSLSGSGLSPYGGSTAASTIRDAREREKKEMSDLNDRLASYIEKVRFLEAQNRKLAVDLDFLRGRWGRDTGNVRDMYEADLKQARKLIDDTNQQRADMEKQIKALRDEIAAMKKKHDEALKARHADKDTIDDLLTRLSALEAEINLLKRRIAVLEDNIGAKKRENQLLVNELQRARNDLDQETLNRIDYQNQVQTLLEEIDFLRRAHDAEIHDLQAMACRDPTGENREYFRNELASAIREIRGEYDQLCQTQRVDMESWYKLKVQEIQTQSARQNIEQSYAKEEVKRLRLQLGDLRGKLADLESRNSLLEKQAEELNYQLEDDQRSYESALNERDAQIRKMRDECQTLMVELQMLLDTKQTLDAEIAIYRKMLEGEEDRAGLRQLVEQVVKTHHHKQVDEAESMRVLRGETASRSSYQRSAKGNVCIWEAAPDGKYVTLENTHRSKEENIGDWKLKRKIDGRREIVFTFPRDFILKPSKTVKVWARGQGVDSPPEQIVFDGEDSFGVGNNVQTILYNTQGEERATLIQRSSGH